MPVVDARGLSLHVQELGAGAPVLMLHGLLLGNLATWLFTVAPAIARTRRAIAFDLRGHGRSERPASGYGVTEMGADLAALQQALGLDGPVDLVGHSYGALVALHRALEAPESVRRLVLVETPLPPSLLQEELDRLARTDPAALLESVPAGLAERLLGSPRRRLKAARTVRELLERTTLPRDVEAEPDIPDERLAALELPVLLVHGTRSSCRGVGARLAQVLPRARLLEIEGSHYLPVEHPDELAAAITDFLDG